MTDNTNTPEAIDPTLDESQVIDDQAALAAYIAEQEILRTTADVLADAGDLTSEELVREAVDITVEQMLSVDNDSLSPEQVAMKTEWRDAIMVQVIAEGVKKSFRGILKDIADGTTKNTKYNQGYMAALNDLYTKLMNIVPDEFKQFAQSNVDIYGNEEQDGTEDTPPNADESNGTAPEGTADGAASGSDTPRD